MPKVRFLNEFITVEAEQNAVLLDVAQQAGIEVFRGLWPDLNCRGLGICGRCKIWVTDTGENVSPRALTERFRRVKGNLRLACKVRVLGDVDVRTRPNGPAYATLKTPMESASYREAAAQKLEEAIEAEKKAAAKKAALAKKKAEEEAAKKKAEEEAAKKKAEEEAAKKKAEEEAKAKEEAEAKADEAEAEGNDKANADEAEGNDKADEKAPATPPPPPAAKPATPPPPPNKD